MVTLIYRDEDGEQSSQFDNREECDDFIEYNESRAKSRWDEKFEVISISEDNE